MKTQKNLRKLSLGAETLRTLSSDELRIIDGGGAPGDGGNNETASASWLPSCNGSCFSFYVCCTSK
jgi:hypothetical protein